MEQFKIIDCEPLTNHIQQSQSTAEKEKNVHDLDIQAPNRAKVIFTPNSHSASPSNSFPVFFNPINEPIPTSETGEYMGMREAAKALNRNIGSIRLFRFLRKYNYLDSRNKPAPYYIQNGFFKEVIKETYGYRGRVRRTHVVTLVSESCIAFIWDQVREEFDSKGTSMLECTPILMDEFAQEWFRKLFERKIDLASIHTKPPTHVSQ